MILPNLDISILSLYKVVLKSILPLVIVDKTLI